jgi:hypothetical protein
MITKKQLESIDYNPSNSDKSMYVRWGSWEYGFDVIKQELWYLNDGFGEPEFCGHITDFEKLKEMLDFYGEL